MTLKNLLSPKNILMPIINSKTLARIASIQTLYIYLVDSEAKNSLNKIIEDVSNIYIYQDVIDSSEVESAKKLNIKINKSYFFDLVSFAVNNIDSNVNIIKSYLSDNWQYENLHLSLQAILLSSTAEFKYFPETPSKVIINEYTNIAADFLKPPEVGFVNSILDKISKDLSNAN